MILFQLMIHSEIKSFQGEISHPLRKHSIAATHHVLVAAGRCPCTCAESGCEFIEDTRHNNPFWFPLISPKFRFPLCGDRTCAETKGWEKHRTHLDKRQLSWVRKVAPSQCLPTRAVCVSVCLFMCVSVCQCVYLCVYLIVCVCFFVCMCVFMFMYVSVSLCVYVVNVYMYVYLWIYICVPMCKYTECQSVCLCVYLWTCLCVSVYLCISVCVCVCLCMVFLYLWFLCVCHVLALPLSWCQF